MNGYILAALAAALYGTNPVFATPLYATGLNPLSVVFCRYLCGVPLLALAAVFFRESFALPPGKIVMLGLTGVTMALSSLTLYASYVHMNPGLASTLLFMYPVLTALIMIAFFHEAFRPSVALSLLVMGAGLALLARGGGSGITWQGFGLVFLSAITYALYLVIVKVVPSIAAVPAAISLFWQLLFGSILYLAISPSWGPLIIPAHVNQWLLVAGLAFFPTLLSLLCTMKAVGSVGPTATAIFGALEPVTAVVLSWLILGEDMTLREILGGCLILASTFLVVAVPQPGHGKLHFHRRQH